MTYYLSQVILNEFAYCHSWHFIPRVVPGECVILVYTPCVDFLIVFLSCIRAGVIPVPVYPPRMCICLFGWN